MVSALYGFKGGFQNSRKASLLLNFRGFRLPLKLSKPKFLHPRQETLQRASMAPAIEATIRGTCKRSHFASWVSPYEPYSSSILNSKPPHPPQTLNPKIPTPQTLKPPNPKPTTLRVLSQATEAHNDNLAVKASTERLIQQATALRGQGRPLQHFMV